MLGEGEQEHSWLSSILGGALHNSVEEEGEGEEVEVEEGEDYVEPPFLDTRLAGEGGGRALVRRSVAREEEEGREGRSCTVVLWRCLASTLEPTVEEVDRQDGLAG